MARIDFVARQIHLEVAFAGTGFSGRCSALTALYQEAAPPQKSRMVAFQRDDNANTLFELAIPPAPGLRGFGLRVELRTVPSSRFFTWQVHHALLSSADGILFVLDRQRSRFAANEVHLELVQKTLARSSKALGQVPHVWMLNKCDLPDLVEVSLAERVFASDGAPLVESCVAEGWGYREALKLLLQLLTAPLLAGAGGHPVAPLELASAGDAALLAAVKGGAHLHQRRSALRELARRGSSELEGALEAARASPHPHLRAEAYQQLGSLPASRALARCLEGAADAHPFPRSEALQALVRWRAPALGEALSAMLTPALPVPLARVTLDALEALGAPEAAPGLAAFSGSGHKLADRARALAAFLAGRSA